MAGLRLAGRGELLSGRDPAARDGRNMAARSAVAMTAAPAHVEVSADKTQTAATECVREARPPPVFVVIF